MPEATNILELAKQYWWVVVIIILGFLIFMLLKGRKLKKIQISREEHQRKDFIKSHQLNFSEELKTLKIGNRSLGQIINISGRLVKDWTEKRRKKKDDKEPEEERRPVEVWEITYRPTFLGLPNIFANLVPLVITKDSTWITFEDKTLHINTAVNILKHFKADIWYEFTDKVNLKDFVTDDSIYRVDMGKMSDAYYRYGVEQSTYDQDKAHVTLQKQQDIDLAKEQRKRLISG